MCALRCVHSCIHGFFYSSRSYMINVLKINCGLLPPMFKNVVGFNERNRNVALCDGGISSIWSGVEINSATCILKIITLCWILQDQTAHEMYWNIKSFTQFKLLWKQIPVESLCGKKLYQKEKKKALVKHHTFSLVFLTEISNENQNTAQVLIHGFYCNLYN